MNDVSASDDPARVLAEHLIAILQDTTRFSLALSGGKTPSELFRLLRTQYLHVIPWRRLQIFQVDERCVAPSSPESNWRMIDEELLAHVPPVEAFRMEAEKPNGAELYEAILRSELPLNEEGAPVFDCVVLGMGADGHTASLFPGTAALEERMRWVVKNEVPQLNTHRVTLTYPVLEAAKERWFLVRGADKAAAYYRARRGELPAGRLDNAHWFISPEVAGA